MPPVPGRSRRQAASRGQNKDGGKLIEAARRRGRFKRGGVGGFAVTLEAAEAETAVGDEELLALDAALQELAKLNPRQASIVESRFFGGLEFAEIAGMLDVSEATVFRDWRVARAWLDSELRRG